MAQTGDDCYFFYFQTCMKGDACLFRHVEEARASDRTCDDWRMNRCHAIPCPYKHMELQPSIPCYFESQPGGCAKHDCQFQHKFPRKLAVSTQPTSTALLPQTVMQQAPLSQRLPMVWNLPPTGPPLTGPPLTGPVWLGPHVPPPHMFTRPPMPGPPRVPVPGFMPYHPAGPLLQGKPPASIRMMQIEPIVIKPNEDSDQDSIKGSPIKPVSRPAVLMVAPAPAVVPLPVVIPKQSSNPLDYFLNAKPWVEPSQRNVYSRPPSPRRASPYRKQGSASPRRSQSPSMEGRHRSVSAERYDSVGMRRRSSSLDRSISPEWRDRRRFGRRPSPPRSPPRRRSRSPGRERGRGVLNRFRNAGRGPKLAEVKVTGSKLISIKKDRKEKDEDDDGEKEKQDEKSDVKVKEQEKAVPVIKEEVKSLEDIYRERALLSMMDAKRKKIQESKRKRWEKVEDSRKSDSDKSDKTEIQSVVDKAENQSGVDEKGDNHDEEMDSSSDSPDDDGDNKSEVDLADDIDIELGEGELESDREASEGKSESEIDNEEESHESTEESADERPNNREKSSVTVPAKCSIKSRLGVKAVEQIAQQASRDRSRNSSNKSRSVKDRLGMKSKTVPEKQLRSGVIKLNRKVRADDVMSRIRSQRESRERRRETKNILMVPQITIKNIIEERKAGIKQRLGLLDHEECDSDSRRHRRKRRGIDDELMKLLREEGVDIDEVDLVLLSKREKKRLLKKLLVQHGRVEEYEAIRKRKKRGFKKRRDRMDEEQEDDKESRRRINIQGRLGRQEEAEDLEDDDDVEDIPSEDEIELDVEPHDAQESSPEKEVEEGKKSPSIESQQEEAKEVIPVQSLEDKLMEETNREDKRRVRAEKDAKLREALEPKSLDDIRKERALKRTHHGDGGIKIAAGQNRRRILLEEDEPPAPADPPVRVTFSGREFAPKRKLIRLGVNREQNENDQPEESKPAAKALKRDRQIYIPPTLKRTDGPLVVDKKIATAITKAAGPPKGREIVDYGDLFPKKSSLGEKTKTVRLVSSASESDLSRRPPLRLQKGPPKVEVKDATVKTFAEIMAEKKRKRLLAQQGKSYTPLVFAETESSSTAEESKSVSVADRLSPLPTEPHVTISSSSNITVSSPQRTQTLKKSVSATNVQQTKNNLTRKKRKTNISEVKTPVLSSVIKSLEPNLDRIDDSNYVAINKVEIKSIDKPVNVDINVFSESGFQQGSISPMKQATASMDESKPSMEKKVNLSDSFMDFEDDYLLNMDDDIDLELDTGNQDPDELMREIDELLAKN